MGPSGPACLVRPRTALLEAVEHLQGQGLVPASAGEPAKTARVWLIDCRTGYAECAAGGEVAAASLVIAADGRGLPIWRTKRQACGLDQGAEARSDILLVSANRPHRACVAGHLFIVPASEPAAASALFHWRQGRRPSRAG